MRKRVSVVSILLALAGVLASTTPAQAFGNDAIIWCNGPVTCYGVQGMAASVRSYHEAGTDNGALLVSSLYLRDPSSENFVEFGVSNTKTTSGTWVDRLFFSGGNIDCGAACYHQYWTKTIGQGVYRLLLSRVGAKGTTLYQIWWDEPGMARQTLYFTITSSVPYVTYGETAAEHSVAGDPLPDFHANTWVRSESTNYPWYAANGSRAMGCRLDNVGNHSTLYYPGSGGTGDEMVYYPTVGNCP